MNDNVITDLLIPGNGRIVMLVLDGLGGLPMEPGGPTELEAADTPHLDRLAREGECGLHQPVGTGITPGSGPAHLALFGYDPVRYQVGRGALSALGTGFDLRPDDVAARGNFCSLDDQGRILDRRAGRLATEESRKLCDKLRQLKLPGIEIFLQTVKEYRVLLVLRGEGMDDALTDTDPQSIGVSPATPRAKTARADRTANLVGQFLEKVGEELRDHPQANMILLRGFAKKPDWPTMQQRFGLRAAALADYPMYRGVARLLGMDVLETRGGLEQNLPLLKENWDDYDFFFLHFKPADSAGEDGDFRRRVALLEEVDTQIPRLRELKPDVLLVTGDHSTPARMRSHSWHPVPALLWSPHCRPDPVRHFGERDCLAGALGPRFPAIELIPLALAHARRLQKYGS
ncbi:MAG: 2,3-bisphosphoglycerate-independent phosphoglycerate mutase [Syntrophotaleaceae bacterium]